MPENEPGISAAPLADSISGRVFAIRGNVAYIANPQTGIVVDTLETELTETATCGNGPQARVPTIRWGTVDETARLLYLASGTFSCVQTAGSIFLSTLVSYQIDSGLKVATGYSSRLPQVVEGGYLYETE